MKDGAGAGGCAGPASAGGDAPDQPCVVSNVRGPKRCVERVLRARHGVYDIWVLACTGGYGKVVVGTYVRGRRSFVR